MVPLLRRHECSRVSAVEGDGRRFWVLFWCDGVSLVEETVGDSVECDGCWRRDVVWAETPGGCREKDG